MQKTLCLILFLLLAFSLNVWSQDAKDAESAKDTQDELNEKVRPEVKTHALFGADVGATYFFGANNTKENIGVFMKVPFYRSHGVLIGAYWSQVPITAYTLGDLSYSGFGEEEYISVRLDYVLFMPFLSNLQASAGLDYYKIIRGGIADRPGLEDTEDTGFGVAEPICHECSPNLFGLNLAANLDIPLFERFYALVNTGLRYILNHPSDDIGVTWEFRIGLGYRFFSDAIFE